MRRSPLDRVHRQSAAVFTPFDGFEIPDHFGDPAAEYRALTTGTALTDRSLRGKIRLTGNDGASFLQGLVTNDLGKLAVGRGLYAILADQRGRIVTDLWIHDRGDHILIETEPGLETRLVAALESFRIMEEVAFADVSAEFAIVGVEGPGAGSLITRVAGKVVLPAAPLRTVNAAWAGRIVALTRRETDDIPAFDLMVPSRDAESLWHDLTTAGTAAGARAAGFRAQESRRIERGIPRGGADLDGEVIVLEARLDHAVSFEKGCYLGQETIAKMHYRGKPRQLLVSFVFGNGEAGGSPDDAPPQSFTHGTPLFSGDERSGRITSAAFGFSLDRMIGLGYVPRDLAVPGVRLAASRPDGPVAEVVELGSAKRRDS